MKGYRCGFRGAMGKNIFHAEGISKSFGATRALSAVDFELREGTIHGLIGENGSGKSTLASIIAGVQFPDDGVMQLRGKPYKPGNTIEAANQGVSMVVQEQGTINHITAAANIFIGKEDRFVKAGFLGVNKMCKEAQGILASIGVGHIRARDMIDSYSFEDRKLVELARALYDSPDVWIIDETTTALTLSGRDTLYDLMRKMREEGKSIIFISHDIEEVVMLCDEITVLRDGVKTATLDRREFRVDRIKQLLIGRELSGHYYRMNEDDSPNGLVALSVENITTKSIKDISFNLHRGEILGVGGLSDCGMHELGKAITGLTGLDSGRAALFDGKQISKIAMAVENGVGYVSKNRDSESMMLVCSVRDNICLPSLKNLQSLGIISRKKENEMAREWMKNLSIKAHSEKQFCNTLSGGNKQKVVLSKWLAKGSDILILDSPTRGIDVGAKASIYKLIEEMKGQGKAIVLISEELPELIGMSDRVLILRNGELTGEFARSDGLTEAKLIEKMI
jgi:ribose transport system ATP-binding protein